ncbi:MAG: hypothetical protein IKJ78_01595 [Bacteroidales bacterium]|nr:hypothetical protein [Bacteroidales bacterium]
MKKFKKTMLLFIAAMSFASTVFVSCEGMSQQDAYDIGYGAGRALRYMIDN